MCHSTATSLEVPVKSPKLNPMENIWMDHKKKLSNGNSEARTFAELVIEVRKDQLMTVIRSWFSPCLKRAEKFPSIPCFQTFGK